MPAVTSEKAQLPERRLTHPPLPGTWFTLEFATGNGARTLQDQMEVVARRESLSPATPFGSCLLGNPLLSFPSTAAGRKQKFGRNEPCAAMSELFRENYSGTNIEN